jgi:hypothetical protein
MKYIKFDDGSIVILLKGAAEKIANHDEVELKGRKPVNAGMLNFFPEGDVETIVTGESFTLRLKCDEKDAETIGKELFD